MNKTDSKQQPVDEQYGNRADDGVKLTTPYGTLQAHGPMVVAVLLLICAVGVIAFMQRDHDMRTQETLRTITENRSAQMRQIADSQEKLHDSIDAVVYVLALPEDQREKLRINMPDSLRHKLIQQDRPR